MYLLLSEDKSAATLYVYGKSLDIKKKKGLFWKLFLLPKRCFIHFYITAVLIFLISFVTVLIYYVPSGPSNNLKEISRLAVNVLSNYNVKIETADSIKSITSLLFTLILMIIQSSRRLYESLFVSVYSSNSKINVIHYLFGNAFYIAAALSTISPIFLSSTTNYTFIVLLDNLVTKQRALAFVLFIYASHYQHKCNKILGNLRKDKLGQVITERHYVPSGGPFQYVSCPHFLAEVVIYFLILMAQEFGHYYWNLIFLLVLSTQTINAVTEHRWYKRMYKEYPKERKAIFPYLL